MQIYRHFKALSKSQWRLLRRKLLPVCAMIYLVLFSATAYALVNQSDEQRLFCKLDQSQDYFMLYADQQSFKSEVFSHFTLFQGLTVIVLNHETLRFNRISNLSLLPASTLDINRPAEASQYMTGSCRYL